jgi:hypothetical protein
MTDTTAGPPPDEADWPRPSDRFLAGMALAQTPRQQQIARQIYDRMAAGATVDDVKPLIDQMARTVAQTRNPDAHIPEPGQAQPRQPHVLSFDLEDDG